MENHKPVDKKDFDPFAIPLNPDLLTSPFKVPTNWIVITGSACTGKTTLIKMLANQGYRVLHETARQYIDQELKKGRSIEEIIFDPYTQTGIYKMQYTQERRLDPNETVFLDRGLPDILTFLRYNSRDPNEILRECFYFRYKAVFILDRLSLQLDGARVDNEFFLNYLDIWLEKDYTSLGYPVIRVPVLPPAERIDFIFTQIPTHP